MRSSSSPMFLTFKSSIHPSIQTPYDSRPFPLGWNTLLRYVILLLTSLPHCSFFIHNLKRLIHSFHFIHVLGWDTPRVIIIRTFLPILQPSSNNLKCFIHPSIFWLSPFHLDETRSPWHFSSPSSPFFNLHPDPRNLHASIHPSIHRWLSSLPTWMEQAPFVLIFPHLLPIFLTFIHIFKLVHLSVHLMSLHPFHSEEPHSLLSFSSPSSPIPNLHS